MNRTIPGGPLNPVPEMPSIPEMLQRTASRIPDTIAVREPLEPGRFRSITYSHLADDMDWLARGLLELNPKPVVGIVGRNSISWYTAYLATMRAGGIVVPIDPALPEADMHHHPALLRNQYHLPRHRVHRLVPGPEGCSVRYHELRLRGCENHIQGCSQERQAEQGRTPGLLRRPQGGGDKLHLRDHRHRQGRNALTELHTDQC